MRSPWLTALLVVALAGAGAGCLREFEDPHRVQVTNLDLAAEKVLASTVVLNLTTYLDNVGGGTSGALRLVAKAFDETTGFRIAETTTEPPSLPGDTTRAISQYLTVPREGSVRLEVQLFEDDLFAHRASISARNLAVLKPEVFETGLQISEIDFIVNGTEPGRGNATRAIIEAQLSITNEASAPSEDLRVQVKAREVSTSLIADTKWLQTGVIAPGTTSIRSVNLSVPDEFNYIVEFLTWRDDTIVDRAEGRVQLAPRFEVPKDKEVVITNPDITQFRPVPTSPTSADYSRGGGYGPGEPVGVPGFGLALVTVAGAAAAIAFGRRRA